MRFAIDDLMAFMGRSEQVQNLIRIADRAGFAPDFPDFEIEKVIPFLEKAKVDDLANIEEFIKIHQPELTKFLKDLRSQVVVKWSASPAFLCILVLVRRFPGVFDFDFLVSNGFSEDHAKIVLSALARQLHG
jgi:hypothetical protein